MKKLFILICSLLILVGCSSTPKKEDAKEEAYDYANQDHFDLRIEELVFHVPVNWELNEENDTYYVKNDVHCFLQKDIREGDFSQYSSNELLDFYSDYLEKSFGSDNGFSDIKIVKAEGITIKDYDFVHVLLSGKSTTHDLKIEYNTYGFVSKKSHNLCALGFVQGEDSSYDHSEDFDSVIKLFKQKMEELTVEYNGNSAKGTIFDQNNKDIVVKYTDLEGNTTTVDDWTISEPVTLGTEPVSIFIQYKDLEYELKVEPNLGKLRATYDGATRATTIIDKSNSGLHVYYTNADGVENEVSDYEISEPVELKEGQKSLIKIKYGDLDTTVTVTGTKYVETEEEFKARCADIPYTDLARTPDNYDGQAVHIYGEVLQVVDEGYYYRLRVGTQLTYSRYLDNVIYVEYMYETGAPRILEGDMIDVYGEYAGIYSYETTVGTKNSIPSINAKYVTIQGV